MDQQAIETALVRWLTAATGLPTRLVEQEGPQLSGDYCTVRVGVVTRTHAVPTQAFALVPGAPAGQELEVTHAERPYVSVQVQAYTKESRGNDCAVAVLEKASQTLVLEAVRAQLAAVGGLAVNRRGTVRSLNALSGPKWQGRAVLELEVNVVEAVTERTTYIETTDVSVVEGG